LKISLPGPSEEVEIINKGAAHKDLGCLIHVGQFNSLLQDFVLIHEKEELRNAWQLGGENPSDFRTLSDLFDEFLRMLRKVFYRHSREILEDGDHSAGGSDPGDSRRGETEGDPVWHL
jgi:hypothetical protein